MDVNRLADENMHVTMGRANRMTLRSSSPRLRCAARRAAQSRCGGAGGVMSRQGMAGRRTMWEVVLNHLLRCARYQLLPVVICQQPASKSTAGWGVGAVVGTRAQSDGATRRP